MIAINKEQWDKFRNYKTTKQLKKKRKVKKIWIVQAWKCSKNNCNFTAYEYTQSTSCPEHGYYFMVKI